MKLDADILRLLLARKHEEAQALARERYGANRDEAYGAAYRAYQETQKEAQIGRVEVYLRQHGKTSGTELCKALGLSASQVSRSADSSAVIDRTGDGWHFAPDGTASFQATDFFWIVSEDAEPGEQSAATQRSARKPGKEKKRRLSWQYAPVPRAIIADAVLSSNAVRLAAVVAASINQGAWNKDLIAKLTYTELGEKAGLGKTAVWEGLKQLKSAGYAEVESLSRGGCQIRFTTPY